MELAERTSDLQRLQAEFVNYKRRVDRDRELIKENATYAALAPITEVLDTIDRAREHAASSTAASRPSPTSSSGSSRRVGLAKFGAAATRSTRPSTRRSPTSARTRTSQVTTCKVIAKAGYRIGDRVVRAAQVLVVDPPTRPDRLSNGSTDSTTGETRREVRA